MIHGSSQPAPYPEFAWDWESVQQYPWRTGQHINVPELAMLLNFLRMRAATGEVAGNGFFTFSTASWLPRWAPRAGHLHAFSTAFVVVSPLSLFVPAAWWCRSGRCRAGNTATLPAGSRCGGVMVKRRSTHRVLKAASRVCGESNERQRGGMRRGVERFSLFPSFSLHDYFLGEFVNHLYQDDSPHQWGGGRICGGSLSVTTGRWHACTCGIGPEH